MLKTFSLILSIFFITYLPADEIVTINSPCHHILREPTRDIQEGEWEVAKEIAEKLFTSLTPYFPAAGLAAPQIGIAKSIFIYSFDRNPEHLEVVINPTMKCLDEGVLYGWEGCFSVLLGGIWKLAFLPRYEAIEVSYTNLKGERIEKRLEGFAAKVFQHEFDHLQGIESIDKSDATLKEFASEEEMEAFLQAVKVEDAKRYSS